MKLKDFLQLIAIDENPSMRCLLGFNDLYDDSYFTALYDRVSDVTNSVLLQRIVKSFWFSARDNTILIEVY